MKKIVKEINFIPDFMLKEKEHTGRRIAVALGTAAIVLICFAVYYLPELKVFSLSEQLKNLNVELNFYSDVKEIKNKLEETEAKLAKKKAILDEISKGEVDVISMLEKLTEAAPQNVALSYLSTTGTDDINVSYIVNNPIEANQLVENLRKLDIFEKVEMPPGIPIVDRMTNIDFKLKLKRGNTTDGTK